MTDNERQIEACRKLGMSDEEIKSMLADDKEVDRGKVMDWDLSTEEHKKAMKYANSDEKKKKKPMALNLDATGKKKKENPTKAGIISFLYESLKLFSQISELLVTNAERQLTFTLDGNDYELTLIQKRKKK